MRDALRACLSELKHGGTKSTETHGGVGDTVGPADRTRRVWRRPEATIRARGSSCVFVSSVAPCFNLLRTRSGSQLIPDRTSARLLSTDAERLYYSKRQKKRKEGPYAMAPPSM